MHPKSFVSNFWGAVQSVLTLPRFYLLEYRLLRYYVFRISTPPFRM